MIWLDYYNQGMTDKEIAAITHYHPANICRLRRKKGLPPNIKLKHDYMKLYKRGMTDLQIAVREEVCTMTVTKWRIKNGLKPNLMMYKLEEMYWQGYSDSQIFKALRCSETYPYWWRKHHGNLPPNKRKEAN
jgi:hypothetical protein